jgi:predicted O-methyltransferase YrrM
MNAQKTFKFYMKEIQISKYVQLGASLGYCSIIMGALAFRSCRIQGFEYFPY